MADPAVQAGPSCQLPAEPVTHADSIADCPGFVCAGQQSHHPWDQMQVQTVYNVTGPVSLSVTAQRTLSPLQLVSSHLRPPHNPERGLVPFTPASAQEKEPSGSNPHLWFQSPLPPATIL